jgi:uncharacterized protein (DUF302 family)
MTFDEAIERATEVLAGQGFGMISDIDVQAKMQEKLGAEMRPYRILGACNPGFAYQAIGHNPEIGLLLPCNVIVYENEDGSVSVSFVRPPKMFQLVDDAGFEPLLAEVDRAIVTAYEAL